MDAMDTLDLAQFFDKDEFNDVNGAKEVHDGLVAMAPKHPILTLVRKGPNC